MKCNFFSILSKKINNELLEGIRKWKYKNKLVKQRHRMSYTVIMSNVLIHVRNKYKHNKRPKGQLAHLRNSSDQKAHLQKASKECWIYNFKLEFRFCSYVSLTIAINSNMARNYDYLSCLEAWG